jgi:hypothetical protein
MLDHRVLGRRFRRLLRSWLDVRSDALCDNTFQPYGQIWFMNADGSGKRIATDSLWEDSMPLYGTALQLFPSVNAANDQSTADLLTQRLDIHEKTAWMLRSLLED